MGLDKQKNTLYNAAIMLKIALLMSIVIGTLVAPKAVLADEQVCTQVYGGGVVCGAKAPEHKPVETGLAENLALMGGAFILASGALLYFSRKTKVNSSFIR